MRAVIAPLFDVGRDFPGGPATPILTRMYLRPQPPRQIPVVRANRLFSRVRCKQMRKPVELAEPRGIRRR